MYYELTDQVIVSADLPTTWKFFSEADNLSSITPPAMKMTILSPRPLEMGLDAQLDYSLRVNGLPIRWRTRIIDWSPQRQFVDLQIRGPYTLWHHQHRFEPVDAGVRCSDRVIYKLPLGVAGRLVHRLSVRRQLLGIFRFRREAIARMLGAVRVEHEVEIRRLG